MLLLLQNFLYCDLFIYLFIFFMGPAKGHMALNSSPFKPSMNKLSSQYLIQDQMSSHYYNLATIKSAIDNKPPESTHKSIKKRDQIRRKLLLQSQWQNSEMQKSSSSQHPMESSRSLREGRSRMKQSEMTSPYNSSKSLDMNNEKLMQMDRNSQTQTARSWSPNSSMAKKSLHSSRPATASHIQKQPNSIQSSVKKGTMKNSTNRNIHDLTYCGDYLERHVDRFHNSGKAPFTPRTKKRPGKSFLAQSEYYAPPPSHMKDKKNKKKKSSSKDDMTVDNVKSLDSGGSRDEDHQRWIEEQSQFVQRLSLLEQQEYQQTPLQSRGSVSEKSETRRKIDDEEEEMKYLDFINDVTNDILARGNYSDSVLQHIMERHVERNKHELDVTRMKIMLIKLRRDLGMTTETSNSVTNPYFVSSTDHFTSFESVRRGRENSNKQDASSHHSHEAPDFLVTPKERAGTSIGYDNSYIGQSSSVVSVSSMKSSLNHSVPEIPEGSESGDVKTSNLMVSVKDEVANLNDTSPDEVTTSVSESKEVAHHRLKEEHSSTEESDYESVAALSMVIKPPEIVESSKPAQELFKPKEGVVVDEPDHEDVGKVEEGAVEDTYADDFQEEDSDDEF